MDCARIQEMNQGKCCMCVRRLPYVLMASLDFIFGNVKTADLWEWLMFHGKE